MRRPVVERTTRTAPTDEDAVRDGAADATYVASPVGSPGIEPPNPPDETSAGRGAATADDGPVSEPEGS